jgi:heme/copper-type cytochrome/quinol oxidase subunit 2
MNRIAKNLLALLFFLLPVSFSVFGQTGSAGPQMDDLMHQNGKIYVVVAVLVVIFIGIILFLVGMERRLRKLEEHPAQSIKS